MLRCSTARLSLFASLVTAAACGDSHVAIGDAAIADATLIVPDAHPDLDAQPNPDAGPPPLLRNPVLLDDSTLALQALQRLGAGVAGADQRCNSCHSLTNAQLRHWGDLSADAFDCIGTTDVTMTASAQAALTCLTGLSGTGGATLTPHGLGIWATAGRLPWFHALYQAAQETTASYDAFIAGVAMPPPEAAPPLNQSELDVVAEWFVRGQPALDDFVPREGSHSCVPGIDVEVSAHVASMATMGWRQVNADNGLSMFGCAGAASTLGCMATEPRAFTYAYGVGWEVAPGQLRLLAELDYTSAYWTRSSPDGRFVAHGGGDGPGGRSTIVDLLSNAHIGIDASYDPTFFPDNSGFVFQGNSPNTCNMSVLLGSPSAITMGTNPGCVGVGIGLYQHLGAAVGGDYFAVSGSYVSDVGSDEPFAHFGANDSATILPMLHNGSNYIARSPTNVPLSFEGDAALSPSTRLLMTRRGDDWGHQISYVLHQVVKTPTANGYDIEIPTIATYCLSGSKPVFSFDERWVLYHHHVNKRSDAEAIELGFTGVEDPGFTPYKTAGAANAFLLDLVTGVTTRITRMAPGQFALFPHFRSDGWIYIQVRDLTRNQEYVVASDYALRAEVP